MQMVSKISPLILSLFIRTPLHASALNDQVECLQLLLKHGGQPNITDNTGKTCIMVAADSGSAGTVGKNFTCMVVEFGILGAMFFSPNLPLFTDLYALI